MTTIVTQHPASVDAYLRHGMRLIAIPPFSKGPTHKGWNQRDALLTDHALLPPGWNMGLAHAYSGTMAVDVDDWNRAAAELAMRGISLQQLYDAPDAVTIDSGRAGHGKLIYRMPFGLALPSHKWMDTDANGKRYNYLDFRCGTANGLTVQDVLPPSIHPMTGRPYQWAGGGHWTRLPQIPDVLLALWVGELARAQQPATSDADPISSDWAEVRSALAFISPDCSREEWVMVGMALHFAGTANNELPLAAQMWDQWSAASATKYPGPKEMETQWRSFRTDKATKVKLGSLYHLATRGGWTRPPPDTTGMFAQVEMDAPKVVATALKPPPPELDFDLMPPVLARAAQDIGAAVGCDPLVPLFAGLAAISGAVDARTRLELRPGFKVPPVLWTMTIGDPADKKSPGSAPMFDVLTEIEREDRPRYQQAMQVYEALEARHEASKKSYLDAAKNPETMLAGELPQGYGDAPKMPVPLRLVVQDVTSQKLVRVCADTPRGVLCYLDEMNSWAGKLADPRGGEQVSTWTTAFESRYYKMDRVGAGEIEADNFAVSMYGNIQPRVFSAHVRKLSEDGLLQRFIPVVLRGHMTRLGTPSIDRKASKAAFDMAIRSVYGLPAMTYTLGEAGEAAYVEFQRWYHQRLNDERLLKANDVYLQAFGKIEGLVGRMILLHHLMVNPFSMQVSAETVERVVEMAKSYIIPSMRYTYNGDLAGASSFDQWMMEHVIQYADTDTISIGSIKGAARRQLEDQHARTQTDMIVAAMYPLEKAGWVARIDDGSSEHRGQGEWAINPSLREQFAKHRLDIIGAKQRMMDYVYRDAEKRKPKVHGHAELLTGTEG